MPALPKFSDRVRHLAVESELWPVLEPMTDQLLSVFPNLQHAYFLIDYSETSAKDMLWAADGKRLCHYHYETCEETTGVGEDAIYRWVWPDLTTQEGKEVAERYSKSAKLGKFSESDPSGKEEAAGLKIWPLLDFSQPRGEEAFQHLLSWAKNGETDVKWPDEPEGDADGSSGEEDDYESSGIDDDPIEQHDDSEESENDLLVVEGSDSSQEDEDDDDDEDEDQEGPGADRTHISAHDPDTFAGFSSPEPSSPATAQGKSNDGSGSDRPSSPPPRSTLKRARGRVVDSDSENNSEDEENNAPRKRARTNLRKRASMSDSEDSEAESEQEPSSPPPRSRRRAPGARTTSRGNLVIQPDDDSSEEERKMRKNAKLLHPELEDDSHSPSDFSSDSESDDQEEEEEEDDKPSRPLTLAEKLAQHRNENPIPSDDEERDYNEFDDEYEYGGTGIDADPMEGTDYDARQYADLEDDEEGHNEDEGLGERPEEDYGRGYGEPEMEPLFDDGEDYGEGGEW
ncbi:hypothetical protein QBC42DRAFT_269532 [Cladorrhinum samala]|uniref:Uncharacterized protein n=1 Tax=Cladorrhinum samala TaxID=585594 RepID=A0AAV9HNX4_9PEZI|nr:hypothetical protein QBC42DRAFT_269532 [Cladorrhinum samala]